MREALLFVIVVAMLRSASGGWLIGLGGDQVWRDFVAPFLGFEEG
jgi:hypothetical protein